MPHLLISLAHVLMLSTNLCLVLPVGLVPFCFPTKIVYAHLLSVIHFTYPVRLLILITWIMSCEKHSFAYCVIILCNKFVDELTNSMELRFCLAHQEIPHICGILRFIILFTTANYSSKFWAHWIQSKLSHLHCSVNL